MQTVDVYTKSSKLIELEVCVKRCSNKISSIEDHLLYGTNYWVSMLVELYINHILLKITKSKKYFVYDNGKWKGRIVFFL